MRPRKMTRDPVGELEDLVELGRDEQGRRARVALGDGRRWMNSMLPTSRPRVGWTRSGAVGSALELAGEHELLLVAAGQRPGG